MLDALISITPWAASFVGGFAANKYLCLWLHAQPAGPVRDALLVVANGGPGPRAS